MRTLLGLGYDGTISFKNSDLIGHVLFQDRDGAHGKERHLFSIGVVDRFRNKGLGEHLLVAFLQSANVANVAAVRLGAGGDAWVTECWQKARSNQLGPPLRFRSGPTSEIGKLVFVR